MSLSILCLAGTVGACSGSVSGPDTASAAGPTGVSSIELRPPLVTLTVGMEAEVEARVKDGRGTEVATAEVKWSSENPSVVEVKGEGQRTARIMARHPGNGGVSGHSGPKRGRSSVTVVDSASVTSVSPNPPTLSLQAGDSAWVTMDVLTTEGASHGGAWAYWTSSNESVLRVNEMGAVTAVGAGSAHITGSFAGHTERISVSVSGPSSRSSGVPAFPGAEGWGARAFQACDRANVEIRRVTSLTDAGPGSLREAIEGSRSDRLSIVTFDVGGYIELESAIELRGRRCLYVAGQTAPGSGVTIRGQDRTLMVLRNSGNSDIALRYLRFRPGTRQPGVNTNSQGLIIGTGENIIVDHLSFSWASDQLLMVYNYPHGWGAPRAITVQRTLLGEPLASSPVCYSTKGETDPDASGVPAWYDVEKVTFHHNAAIHCSHRAPMIVAGEAEVLNNIVYNWNLGAMHTEGRKPFVDYVGNYFRAGPATRLNTNFAYEISHKFAFNRPGGWGGEPNDYVVIGESYRTRDGRTGPGIFLSGNVGPNFDGSDQWSMTSKYKNDEEDGYPEANYPSVEYGQAGLMPVRISGVSLRRTSRLSQPPDPVSVQSAEAAWSEIIGNGNVGANSRLTCSGDWVPNQDPVDQRLLEDARDGSGPTRDTFVSSQEEVGGFPDLDAGEACRDADRDGMPDDFENRYGLDPDAAWDASQDSDDDGYSNLEEYVNGTRPR